MFRLVHPLCFLFLFISESLHLYYDSSNVPMLSSFLASCSVPLYFIVIYTAEYNLRVIDVTYGQDSEASNFTIANAISPLMLNGTVCVGEDLGNVQ